MKRIGSLALALAMAGSMLAGCANAGSTSSTSAATSGEEAAGASSAASEEDMPVVRMIYPLISVPSDIDQVEAALNSLTMEKIGVKLELEPVAYASYSDQMNLILAGTEQYDLAMVMGSNLASYIAKDALVGLNDLLDTCGAGAKEALGDYLYAGALNGEVYGLSAIRSMANQQGVVMRKDLVEKYNIDVSAIQNEEDLTAVFETVSAGEPDMYMIRPESAGDYGWLSSSLFDPLGDYIGVLGSQAQTLQVVNYAETEEYAAQARLHREWYTNGWIPEDLLTSSDSAWDLVAAGKLFAVAVTIKPGTEQEKSNSAGGVEFVAATYGEPISYTSKVNSFTWTILQNTADAEAAMKVLNLMYTDADFVNLIDWGIEDVHYQHVDGYDNVITFADGLDASTSGYFHSMNYEFGNQLLSYVWEGDSPDLWEETKVFNENAILSKAMGFAWDVSPVKTEYTAVSNVRSKYEFAITSGFMDYDSTIDTYLQELKDAGIDKIIAEKQSQIDEWAKSSGVA